MMGHHPGASSFAELTGGPNRGLGQAGGDNRCSAMARRPPSGVAVRTEEQVKDSEQGMKIIREVLPIKEVLVVLDDVAKEQHIEHLIGNYSLCSGSRSKDKVIALDIDGFDYFIEITNQEFERLQNLRYLKLCNGTYVGDFAKCRSKLTWIYWRCPHRDFRVDNMYLNHLVVFELGSSGFTDDSKVWDLIKRAQNLRVISLTECDGLTTIPDFSKCLHLQRLTLAHCSRLKRIQSFIGHLQSLIEIDIEGCIGLTELPEELGALAKLQRFSLQGCYGLCELPSSLENLTSLIELDLSSTGIAKSNKITRCNLRWIERLSRLKKLDLNLSNICALPELASLSHLEELTVTELIVSEQWAEFKKLPPSLKHLRIIMGTSSIELIAPSNSKTVFKLDWCDRKDKLKAMKIASGFSGVDSIHANLEDRRLVVAGDIDAMEMLRKLMK
ncbi:hypothetical protein ACJRO7_015792, partial [Eucalyptus globulus]